MRREIFGAAALAVLFAACSGSTTTPPGVSPDGGAPDGGADASPAKVYTLDDVCAAVPQTICALRKPCCEKTSTYDEAGCIAREKAVCEKDVADARAGRATFHGARIDPCVEKLRPIFENDCNLTFDTLYDIVDRLRECAIFEGSGADGAACERDSQCTRSTDPSSFTGCDEETKRCKTTRFLAEGATCRLGDGATEYCKKGLYCDADLGKPAPFEGKCRPATPIGKTCDGAKRPFSLECGLGNYCESTTGVCAVGNPGGTACIKAEEFKCASFRCEAGACAASNLVKDAECKGR